MNAPAPPADRGLGRRTWPEVRWTGLLIPVGSTEQHGPHLPVDTDAVIAGESAHRLADRLGDLKCLVAPTLTYGSSGEHAGFAGTLSIGTDALRTVLVELVRSASSWASWVVFVNGHGGNASALVSAVSQMRDEGHQVGWVPCAVPHADAHAGHVETSIMLHLAPETVDLSVAERGNCEPIEDILPTLRTGGIAAVSPSGVLGDPRNATASVGASLFALMVEDQERRVRAFAHDRHGMLVPL
ncbi:MAG: mycofactocin biosynthesis peptidyl-dipeptidase MftE [Actinomycetota bacterium]|nr:mycofactocin biosynthesis peptidyl-dipeptidase MftE [Actinomycetota bacterium]